MSSDSTDYVTAKTPNSLFDSPVTVLTVNLDSHNLVSSGEKPKERLKTYSFVTYIY